MSAKNNQTITEKTQALDQLVAWFHGDEFRLEEALDKFTEAEKVASEIEEELTNLKNKIEIVKKKFDA